MAASTKLVAAAFPTPLVSFYHFAGLSRLFPKSKRFGRYNMSFADENQDTEVDSVVGAFMLIRKAAIARSGLLDESFFMYGEDLDWAYRIQRAGYKIWYHSAVTVRHVKRAASSQSGRARFEFWRAMLIFYRKHFRRGTILPLHLLILTALLMKGGPALWREIRNPTPSA